jgi:hypothetical protein
MVAEIFGGISAFKSMLDMAKCLKDINDGAVRQGIVIALQEQILSAQAAQSDLTEEVRTLKKELAKLEQWETEKQQYELKTLGSSAFAYMLKPEARGSRPPHWVCTRCYSDGYAEIIQQTKGHRSMYACPRCDAALTPSLDAFEIGTGRPKWLD